MQIYFNRQIKPTNNINRQQTNTSCITFNGVNDSFEKYARLFTKQFLEKQDSPTSLLTKLRKSDFNAIKLKKLVAQYKKTLSIEDKIKLLKHEEKILWQELDKLEIGFCRNITELSSIGVETDEAISAIKLAALDGLVRTIQSYEVLGVKFKNSGKKLKILQNVIENTPEPSPYSLQIKNTSLNMAAHIAPDSEKYSAFLNYVLQHETNAEIKDRVKNTLNGENYNEIKLIKSLNNVQTSIVQKISTIKVLGIYRSEKLTKILPQLIKNENTNKKLKILLIWTAGRCQSNETFKLLYKIANDKRRNFEQREMALHSIALYIRKNKAEVKETLHKVIKEKSDLSELAQILLEKVEGRYHTKDRELNHLHLSEGDKNKFKKTKKKYIQTHDDKLNIRQTNFIDRALAPFKTALEKIARMGSKAHIIKDTMTLVFPENTGARNFNGNIEYGGSFFDSIVGFNVTSIKPNELVFNKNRLNIETEFNTLAHEFNHNFLFSAMDKKDKKRLELLYKKATVENKCLDYYSAIADYEYFAQGYEAYCAVYKPHQVIINNNDYNNTEGHVRSTLKRKDPELYKFIEYCIKKYN